MGAKRPDARLVEVGHGRGYRDHPFVDHLEDLLRVEVHDCHEPLDAPGPGVPDAPGVAT
jgi:hypothetical protein